MLGKNSLEKNIYTGGLHLNETKRQKKYKIKEAVAECIIQ